MKPKHAITKSIIVVLALLFLCGKIHAQTITNLTTVDKIIDLIGSPTNYAAGFYGTYAPKAPTKVGGGGFIAYNFNHYVGAQVAADWLGQWSLISGSITLQAPFHLTTILPSGISSDSWIANVILTPYARAGVATAYSGGGKFNGAASVDTAVGGYIKFGHLLGGNFDVGGDFSKWQGSGAYDVPRYHVFLAWSKGF